MVVSDDEHFFALIPQLLDSFYPVFELFFGVEVVVSLIPAGIFFEPVLVVASMKSDVGEFGIGADGTGLNRIAKYRLVDVAEAYTVFSQKFKEIWRIPGGMSHFQGQRKICE